MKFGDKKYNYRQDHKQNGTKKKNIEQYLAKMSPITFKEYKNRHVQFIKILVPLYHTITIGAFEFNTYYMIQFRSYKKILEQPLQLAFLQSSSAIIVSQFLVV